MVCDQIFYQSTTEKQIFDRRGSYSFKMGKMFGEDKHRIWSLRFSKSEINYFSINLKISFNA